MASGTADLQRDLGGAIMQSIFGALLTAGYAAAVAAAIAAAPDAAQITDSVQSQLTMSFAGAEDVAAAIPAVRDPDHRRRPKSFLEGDQWAYMAGIIAVLLGAALVSSSSRGATRSGGCWPSTTRRISTRAATPPVLQPRPAGVSPTGVS